MNVTCIFCAATVHVDMFQAHVRWHEQNALHGVDCGRTVQANQSTVPTECTCGLT